MIRNDYELIVIDANKLGVTFVTCTLGVCCGVGGEGGDIVSVCVLQREQILAYHN